MGPRIHALLQVYGPVVAALALAVCLLLASCTEAQENAAPVASSSTSSTPVLDVSDTRISSEIQAEIDAKAEAERAKAEAEEKRKQAEAEAARIAAMDMSSQIAGKRVLAAVPKGKKVAGFSMNSARTAPRFASGQDKALRDAAAAVEEAGYTCGAVIIDTKSGLGIAYNADEPIYTASSFKAPFAYFVLQHGTASDADRNNIESSILHSDNDAFEALARRYYLQNDYREWVAAQGIEYDSWSPWYPDAPAASMAACWGDIFQYIASSDADPSWFKDLLARTNISFIRNALEGEDVAVFNKGGWLADPEYNAVADCGIVQTPTRSYIIAVLSDQPSSGNAQQRVVDIIRALWSMRGELE